MKRLSIPLRVIFTILAITILTACLPGQELPSAEEIESAIKTSVAMTIEAEGKIATSVELTIAAREGGSADDAQATATLSPTPLPSLTPVLATATPFTISSGGGGGGGGGGGTTKQAFSCDIIRQRPIDNTWFSRTNTFDVTFTILNNGTATWEIGKDLTLLGDHGVLSPDFATIELPEMKPGDTFTIPTYDGAAPNTVGHYVIDWKLEGGFCYPYVAFNVGQP